MGFWQLFDFLSRPTAPSLLSLFPFFLTSTFVQSLSLITEYSGWLAEYFALLRDKLNILVSHSHIDNLSSGWQKQFLWREIKKIGKIEHIIHWNWLEKIEESVPSGVDDGFRSFPRLRYHNLWPKTTTAATWTYSDHPPHSFVPFFFLHRKEKFLGGSLIFEGARLLSHPLG